MEWEEVGETCLERVWRPLYRDLLRRCWDRPGRGCLEGYLCSQDIEELQHNRMQEAEIEGGLDALWKIENRVRPGPLYAGRCGPLVLTLEATPPQCRLFRVAGVTRWASQRSETGMSRSKCKDLSPLGGFFLPCAMVEGTVQYALQVLPVSATKSLHVALKAASQVHRTIG